MPGRTHQMRAKYFSFVVSVFYGGFRSTSHSQCERPLGAFELLGLHRTEPAHNISGFLEF